MARYKEYSYEQGKFIPIHFDKQILPGTFEYTLSYVIDDEIDLSLFDQRYKNDETGAPAYDPAILLKIILYAYSRGIVSSRKIAQCCCENIIFMALSADTRPHFTTIADFISSLGDEIIVLFRDVLLICDEMKLIGKDMFSIDGCKLPSNASKEWSGTKADFQKKKQKMERAIRRILKKHREMDLTTANKDVIDNDKRYIATLHSRIRKIKRWLDANDDKPGKSGRPIKSNITDNDSAKMKTSQGVIQGYDGVATADSKHQVVVHAEAFGVAQEHDLLEPMVKETRENFQAIGAEDDVFDKTKLLADAGFHTEANMKMLAEESIDSYVADILFRKRDPRFADRDRYKERHRQERRKLNRTPDMLTVRDFTFDEDMRFCICPAGKRMYRNGGNVFVNGYHAVKFRGRKTDCRVCELRPRCLRHPDRTEARQVYYFTGKMKKGQETYTQKMKYKIDSTLGRFIYSKRIGISEPVFANIRHALGLNRFTLRGNRKVDIQWKLYCIVHNLLKIHRYGPGFA
ncbi:MAG: transposase [Deltaproteobacteria bacterium]|nr:transposase [Deltaproteobacteria bacterium]